MRKTLLIMAAGMGSRFGGLKQAEPVGPNGEFIIDYSIYDAMKAGFDKVVFIIKEENYNLFRDTVGKRVENQIETKYVFQKMDTVPSWLEYPKDRVKPWGTAHAVLAAKDVIDEPFAIINADDFYGRDAFLTVGEFLGKSLENNANEYVMIGYRIDNTLTENGSVKRGVAESNNGILTNIIESKVEKIGDTIVAKPLDDREPFQLQGDSLVSMNMFGFMPTLFDYIEKRMDSFFKQNLESLNSCEYLIPTVVFEMIEKGLAQVNVLPTTAKWQGITYLEDKENLVNGISDLISKNEYPKDLWGSK